MACITQLSPLIVHKAFGKAIHSFDVCVYFWSQPCVLSGVRLAFSPGLLSSFLQTNAWQSLCPLTGSSDPSSLLVGLVKATKPLGQLLTAQAQLLTALLSEDLHQATHSTMQLFKKKPDVKGWLVASMHCPTLLLH
jgi:hypothetical protein